MDFVGRRQVKVRITQAAIAAGRNSKNLSKRASERLQRTVVGIQGNVRDRRSAMPQLICRPFQQEPPSHGCRSFFDHGSEQPVELRPALIRLARQILRFCRRVQGVRDDGREPVRRILPIRFLHASGSLSRKNQLERSILNEA